MNNIENQNIERNKTIKFGVCKRKNGKTKLLKFNEIKT